MKRFSRCLGCVPLLLFSASLASASSPWDSVQPLPPEIAAEARDASNASSGLKLGHLGDGLSNAFFERITHLGFSTNVHGMRFGVKVGRDVFSNNDLEESFTVVDRLSLPITIKSSVFHVGPTWFTFSLGIEGGLDSMNIRVIHPPADAGFREKNRLVTDLVEGADLEARRTELQSSEWLSEASQSAASPASGTSSEEKPDSLPPSYADTLHDARYGDLWNLISAPLRIPFKAGWLSRLGDGEVMSYAGTGTIETGPGLHWNIWNGNERLSPLDLGVDFRVYLRGDFRISIQKLSAQRARVKVSRRIARGDRFSAGATSQATLFEGFTLIGSKTGALHSSLIPIQIAEDHSWGSSFEEGFEFDLRDPQAIEAYEAAVLGRFGKADELAKELQGTPSPVVSRIFSRTLKDDTVSRVGKIQFFVFRREGDSAYSIQDARLEMPDGSARVFRATTNASFQEDLDLYFWRRRERMSFSIAATAVEGSGATEPATFSWTAEGRITDDYTSGTDLNRYSRMIETLFGTPNLFPVVPQKVARVFEDDFENAKTATTDIPTHYGSSTFYYRLGLEPKQILAFAETPADRMWPALEKGFDTVPGSWANPEFTRAISRPFGWVGDFLGWITSAGQGDPRLSSRIEHAAKFHEAWLQIQDLAHSSPPSTPNDARTWTRALGEMYSDPVFSYELMKTTVMALHDQGIDDIAYQITASSSAFAPVQIQGKNFSDVEKFAEKYDRETNFDQPILIQDPELGISNVQVPVVNGAAPQATFQAAQKPTLVVIRLDRIDRGSRITTPLKRLLVPNRDGFFHEGANSFVLDPSSRIGFERELGRALEPEKHYRLSLALVQGPNTGPAASAEFDTPAP